MFSYNQKIKKFWRFNDEKIGKPPGSLIFDGIQKVAEVKLHLISFDSDSFEEKELPEAHSLGKNFKTGKINWIDITGLHELDVLNVIKEELKIHPLIMEDILNTNQRPKLEETQNYNFITLKMIRKIEGNEEFIFEHVGILWSQDRVITFQESPGDVFSSIRNRIREGKGRIRKENADYLVFAIIDAIIDNYFLYANYVSDKTYKLEEELLDKTNPDFVNRIHLLKREIIHSRSVIFPLWEVLSEFRKILEEEELNFIIVYIKDAQDHLTQVLEALDSNREVANSILDAFYSDANNNMNQIMRVLTIVATIFMPLTFIAGIYGMNFKYMPELEYPYGYFIVLFIMVVVAISMMVYFKIKKWL